MPITSGTQLNTDFLIAPTEARGRTYRIVYLRGPGTSAQCAVQNNKTENTVGIDYSQNAVTSIRKVYNTVLIVTVILIVTVRIKHEECPGVKGPGSGGILPGVWPLALPAGDFEPAGATPTSSRRGQDCCLRWLMSLPAVAVLGDRATDQ